MGGVRQAEVGRVVAILMEARGGLSYRRAASLGATFVDGLVDRGLLSCERRERPDADTEMTFVFTLTVKGLQWLARKNGNGLSCAREREASRRDAGEATL